MSKIEWTNLTWNPITGCNKISAGCKFCYAEVMHRRLRSMYPKKYSKAFSDGVETHESELYKPLTWRKPRMIFVNSMSDLFHDDVPFTFIDSVYDTMEAAEWHTFQVVTKRAERMYEFYEWKAQGNGFKFAQWPLKNVWLLVSVEKKDHTDRIDYLAKCDAVVRGVSCEPLLGPLNLDKWMSPCIDWVICGGESGNTKGIRPMHPDWARSLRDQCKAADVPFFFKQWGKWLPFGQINKEGYLKVKLHGKSQFDGAIEFQRVCKSKSGNFLDGKQHLEFPKQ